METGEQSPQTSKPVVTHKDLLQRIKNSRETYMQFTDLSENMITGNSGLKNCDWGTASVHLEEKENEQPPTRGVLFTQINGFEFNGVSVTSFFAKNDLSEQTQKLQDSLQRKGLNALTTVATKLEIKKDGIEREDEKNSIHIVSGPNASSENLEWIVDNRKNYKSFDDYKRYLQDNGLTHVKISGINRTIWHADMSDRRGSWEYNDGKSVKYSNSIEISVVTPFTDTHPIDQSIDEARQIIEGLTETRYFDKPQDNQEFILKFEGVHVSAEKVEQLMDKSTYQTMVGRIHKDMPTTDTPQTFEDAFRIDLNKIPFFEYNEAVRITKLVNEDLVRSKLIARQVVCELSKGEDNRWNILLPAAQYVPLIEDYRTPYPHSRIDETWSGKARSELLQSLQRDDDESTIRGYLIQFSDGSMSVALDESREYPDTILDDLQRFKVTQDMKGVFNQMVLEQQIQTRIDQDVELLKLAGASTSEIALYSYWQQRKLIQKDRRQIPPDKVQWRLDEIESKLYKLRQNKKNNIS